MSDTEIKDDGVPAQEPSESHSEGGSAPHPSPSLEPAGEELNSFALQKPKLKELIRSPDTPSRYLTWLSLAFGLLAFLCYGLLAERYLAYRKSLQNPEVDKAEEERLYGGWLNKQNYFRKRLTGEDAVYTQELGEFRVSWPGAELRADLVAECTDQDTCTALKSRPEQIHDLLLPVLQMSSQEKILNPNGKLDLRRNLSDKLNELKLKGKIIQVDFSDLTVEPAPNHE